jgi:hypothetical protein
MKNIVAFTLFGWDSKYYVGAEKNIQQIGEMLPDWEVRIYYHENMILEGAADKLSNLRATLINVKDMVVTNNHPIIDYPYFWRFFSFFENSRAIVRDLDSRFSHREVTYINKWIESDRDYFIIRDHPWHSPVPSGLFGIKKQISDFKDHFVNFIDNRDIIKWGDDQEILDAYMKNIDKNDIYYCGYDVEGNYIPRDDKNFFIGLQLDENDKPIEPNGSHSVRYLNEVNL